MKQLLFMALAISALSANAQFTLEHTYDNAATWNHCQGNFSQLLFVKFESSGERFVNINRCDGQIELYDINHASVKTVSLASIPKTSTGQYGAVLYLSETLFDTDDGMEFMYVLSGGDLQTWIYDDDGSIMFYEDGAPMIMPNIHLQQYPIYNTTTGTKLILSYVNGEAKVFGLAGKLTTAIQAASSEQVAELSVLSGAYPNPANSSFKMDYSLPQGCSSGEIVFNDLQGREVKRFKVNNSGQLSVSTADIAAGTYYCHLVTDTEKTGSQKVIVIR